MALQGETVLPWAVRPVPLIAMVLFFCLEVRDVMASATVLPRFSLNHAGQGQRQGYVVPRITSTPSAETSACHSLAESLATDAPTMPLEILSFEASYLMTASGCQTITPPASLSSQWSSWTSGVDVWMDVHSSAYTSYLSRCEAWELVASLQCPTGTATMDTTVTETASETGGPTGDASDTTAASVTVTTSTATATPNSTTDNTASASTSSPSATLVSSGVGGRASLERAAIAVAVLLFGWTVI